VDIINTKEFCGIPKADSLQGGNIMKTMATAIFSLLFVLICSGLSLAAEQDVIGGKDHPLLSRMNNFRIESYEDKDFDGHKFVEKIGKPATQIEGHFYSIRYRLNTGAAQPGELKIRRNIQDALKKIGGKVVFDDNFNRRSTIVLQKDGKETWVDVNSGANYYNLWIVEKEVMKQEVVADAAAMGNDLTTTGHVSIYGIYFDTGKSEIKPESAAAILEIAKLLQNDGALQLYVVGHTDNVGSLDYNMKLSKERADAVAKTLSDKYGIAAARLKAHGVASLVPVTTNDTDEGKARNRRVELVKQ
jgi:outer membrane protein OmpA-like peptidoglycan-associated protein